jgi:hypothetical protein
VVGGGHVARADIPLICVQARVVSNEYKADPSCSPILPFSNACFSRICAATLSFLHSSISSHTTSYLASLLELRCSPIQFLPHICFVPAGWLTWLDIRIATRCAGQGPADCPKRIRDRAHRDGPGATRGYGRRSCQGACRGTC